MNTPNKLTLLRIVLVLPFIGLLIAVKALNQTIAYSNLNTSTVLFIVSGVIFAFAMLTDFIDGHLARKNNQVTTFGKLFDPLADKIITSTAMIFLSILGIVPIYFTLIFILRDIVVDGSRNLAAANNVNVAASIWGKSKTMLQSIGLLIMFFVTPVLKVSLDAINPSWELWVLNTPLIIASVLSLISGYQYFNKIVPFLKTK